MKKFICNAWNLGEIGLIAGGGYVVEHMAHRLSQQATTAPFDPAALLFTIHQACFVLFWLGLTMVVVKAVDSPMQRALSEWAGMAQKPVDTIPSTTVTSQTVVTEQKTPAASSQPAPETAAKSP
jgi:hypothetical protein